jgi:cytochrome b561
MLSLGDKYMNDVKKLGTVTVALHWIVGISIILMLIMGIYMTYAEVYPFYWAHKSLGVGLFIVILARVIYRLYKGWPTPVGTFHRFENLLSKFVHWTLLIGTLTMPIAGMIHSGASGHGFGFFWFYIVDTQSNAAGDDVVALSETWTLIGKYTHQVVGFAMVVFILLHVAGAVKHHFFYKDATLMRMLGRNTK